MREQVEVRIHGIHSRDGETTEDLTEAVGTCRFVAGNWHVLYDEQAEEGGECTRCHLVFRDTSLEMHRRGLTETDFVFCEGRRTETRYRTPYGEVPMEIETGYLSIREFEKELFARVRYHLYTGGEELNETTVEIRVRDLDGLSSPAGM